jgi:hypothetical protein
MHDDCSTPCTFDKRLNRVQIIAWPSFLSCLLVRSFSFLLSFSFINASMASPSNHDEEKQKKGGRLRGRCL